MRRLPSPAWMRAVWLQYFGAACVGIAVALVLDHFGLVGGQEEGTLGELLGAAGFLVAGGLLYWIGTVLRRRRD
jgi:hypothetical protein